MHGLYIVGCERACGLSAIALGVYDVMARRFGRLGVFCPVVAADGLDSVLSLLRSRGPADMVKEAWAGVSFDELHADQDAAVVEIVARYRALERARV